MADDKPNGNAPALLSRKDAATIGSIRFFTGVPCLHGHISERYVSTNGCVECVLLRDADKIKKAEKARRWRQKNKIKRAEYQKAWLAKNPEKRRARKRKQYANAKARGSLARKKGIPRSVRIKSAFDLIILQKGRCAHCATYLGGDFHLDHIVPRSKGGADSKKNFQLLCPACNIKKSAKTEQDVFQEKGLLI